VPCRTGKAAWDPVDLDPRLKALTVYIFENQISSPKKLTSPETAPSVLLRSYETGYLSY
jgi:hypothetical protein